MEIEEKLIFSPKNTFSKRFPNFFFTFSIDEYETKNSLRDDFCFFGIQNKSIIMYKINIMRGRSNYCVYRRFSEFFQLQQDLYELMLKLNVTDIRKTFLIRTYCDISNNKELLGERLLILNRFMTEILTICNDHNINNITPIKKFLNLS
jgi:hypothetical protein